MSRISNPACSTTIPSLWNVLVAANAIKCPPGFNMRRHSIAHSSFGMLLSHFFAMKSIPYGGSQTIASIELSSNVFITSTHSPHITRCGPTSIVSPVLVVGSILSGISSYSVRSSMNPGSASDPMSRSGGSPSNSSMVSRLKPAMFKSSRLNCSVSKMSINKGLFHSAISASLLSASASNFASAGSRSIYRTGTRSSPISLAASNLVCPAMISPFVLAMIGDAKPKRWIESATCLIASVLSRGFLSHFLRSDIATHSPMCSFVVMISFLGVWPALGPR